MFLIDGQNCPICNAMFVRYSTEEESSISFTLQCKSNGCFEYNYWGGEADAKIFNEWLYCGNVLSLEITERIKKKIDFWKEKDRYLMQILSK